jgi:hypothetical protein
MGIVKDLAGYLEADAVIGEVAGGLFLVPLEIIFIYKYTELP